MRSPVEADDSNQVVSKRMDRFGTRRSASNASYISGFYRTLNDTSIPDESHSSSTQTLQLGSGAMPEGCFLVERIVSKRMFKVSNVK